MVSRKVGWSFKSGKSCKLRFICLIVLALAFLSVPELFAGSSKIADTKVANDFDLVILNARVIDPETGLDKTGLNIGIRGRTIEAITPKAIKGHKIINADGRVASPGLIDLLTYDPTEYGVWFKVADGVTTTLAMHGGAVYPNSWLRIFEKRGVPVNFGAAFFYNGARLKLGIGHHSTATKTQVEELAEMAKKAILKGALGIGMSLEYAPGTTRAEVLAMMEVAAKFDVPVFFHVRHSDMEAPGTNIEALEEVLTLAKKTGASIHIDHLNSTGGTFSMKESLEMLRKAKKAGVDITACTYPYPYWATYLNSARFSKGWQKRFRITYKDLQLGGTKEILTKESFKKYKKQGKLAVAYAMPEEEIDMVIAAPFVMIGSDGMIQTHHNNHPRGAGAFARTISEYVYKRKVITLMDAISKMTIMPAKRLEKMSSAMKKKGRIQLGADADIIVFDPLKVKDKATVEKPNQFSRGFDYVINGGVIVKDPKGFNKKSRPGLAIRYEASKN
ncbi:MAG: amidohydrolase family protein [Deltaproteobacteria bacterium]|nr:amidohydrolase family protein [Deltaproteobacteria bacterium]